MKKAVNYSVKNDVKNGVGQRGYWCRDPRCLTLFFTFVFTVFFTLLFTVLVLPLFTLLFTFRRREKNP